MKTILAAPALAIAALSSGIAGAEARVTFYAEARTTLYEETAARDEERHIIRRPLGGLENRYWYDYRHNVAEAQAELDIDLRRADDDGDLRNAWVEYARELRNERHRYVDAMSRRGLLDLEVSIGD